MINDFLFSRDCLINLNNVHFGTSCDDKSKQYFHFTYVICPSFHVKRTVGLIFVTCSSAMFMLFPPYHLGLACICKLATHEDNKKTAVKK